MLLASCGGTGVAVQARDERSALEKASEAGDVVEVRRLLADKADRRTLTLALTMASRSSSPVAVMGELLKAGADPSGPAEESQRCWVPPLYHAALRDHLGAMTLLLDAGAAVQPRTRCGAMPLAALKTPALELLVQRGYDLQMVDAEGRNELHRALSPHMPALPEAVDYLLSRGVPVNGRDRAGKTPLAYWREPREYERAWLATWLFERIWGDQADFGEARRARVRITERLKAAGAVL